MNTALKLATPFEDKTVSVDGIRLRYLEAGKGHPVVLFHGASLGSSADVFRRNLGPLAAGGFRVLALDFPGYGLSDYSEDGSAPFKKRMALGFLAALGIERAALVGHSQSGNMAVNIAIERPELVSHVIILGTGPLLPPLESAGAMEGKAQQRLERRMSKAEPTVDDTRKLLEANLFHHELITDEELNLRHARSIGPCFKAFVARSEASEKAKAAGKDKSKAAGKPQHEKLHDVTQPLLLIYGREDRARAGARAELLKSRHPNLNLHIADGCKHLVPWDAEDLFHRLAIPFLKA